MSTICGAEIFFFFLYGCLTKTCFFFVGGLAPCNSQFGPRHVIVCLSGAYQSRHRHSTSVCQWWGWVFQPGIEPPHSQSEMNFQSCYFFNLISVGLPPHSTWPSSTPVFWNSVSFDGLFVDLFIYLLIHLAPRPSNFR